MSEKVLISLEIPLLELEYDLLIPENKKVGNIKKEIIKTINEIYPMLISEDQNFSLYEKTNGTVLLNDKYAKNYIKNGSHIILI